MSANIVRHYALTAGETPWRRDAVQDIKSAPQTFSSWHNCMQKSYCKWPAIIGIIIACVVVISIVWCLARCLCCGLSCCCSCFSCFESCCPSGRRDKRRSRYADRPGPFQSAPYQGYQPTPAPPAYEPRRFATFDTSSNKNGKIHDDALPAMPSWDNAVTRKVDDPSYHEDVEMGNLDPTARQSGGGTNTAGRNGRGGYSEIPSAPGTPYREHPGANYRGTDATSPFASGQAAIGGPNAGEHFEATEGYNNRTSQNYGPGQGASPYAAGPGATFPEPAQNHGFENNQYGQGYHATSPPHELPPTGVHHDQMYMSSSSPPAQQTVNYHAPPQDPYSAYTPSTSTRYEPSTYQPQEVSAGGQGSSSLPAANRPPSLLQPGRKPVQGSWKAV